MGEDELALVSFKRASKMNRKFKAAGKAYMDTRRRMQDCLVPGLVAALLGARVALVCDRSLPRRISI